MMAEGENLENRGELLDKILRRIGPGPRMPDADPDRPRLNESPFQRPRPPLPEGRE